MFSINNPQSLLILNKKKTFEIIRKKGASVQIKKQKHQGYGNIIYDIYNNTIALKLKAKNQVFIQNKT